MCNPCGSPQDTARHTLTDARDPNIRRQTTHGGNPLESGLAIRENAFRLYAVIITGMFLYGFLSVLYALIFDHSDINSASFGYLED